MAWWNWWTRWLDLGEGDEPDLYTVTNAEFREVLLRELPDLRVESGDHGVLLIHRQDDDPIRMNLPRLTSRMDPGATPEERQATYASWLEALRQIAEPSQITPAWRSQLLVRLVTVDWIQSMEHGHLLVARPVPGLGLYAAAVFDFPTSVRYVTRSDLDDLDLDEAGAHECALANLRGRMPEGLIRDQIEAPQIRRYIAMDSYEAARILLIPELLEPGEAVGVAIPERGSLVLFPADSAPEVVERLSESNDPEPLLTRGVLVTGEGFELL